jgi:hypothetical protein
MLNVDLALSKLGAGCFKEIKLPSMQALLPEKSVAMPTLPKVKALAQQ